MTDKNKISITKGEKKGIPLKDVNFKMDHDKYDEVINGPDTYRTVAQYLYLTDASMLMGWTDQAGSHFDILFTYRSMVANRKNIQGGVEGSDLFVSVMRVGAFGFEIENEDTMWTYYDEKLGRGAFFGDVTGKAIGDLINGIKKELFKLTHR